MKKCNHNIFMCLSIQAGKVISSAELDIVDGWVYLDLVTSEPSISVPPKHKRKKWKYCPLCGEKLGGAT